MSKSYLQLQYVLLIIALLGLAYVNRQASNKIQQLDTIVTEQSEMITKLLRQTEGAEEMIWKYRQIVYYDHRDCRFIVTGHEHTEPRND